MANTTDNAFIQWDDKFSIGIVVIDEHHQRLVELLNTLYFGVFRCDAIEQESELTGNILAELESYAAYHFNAEEEILRQYQYPGYGAHKHEHEYFLKQLRNLITKHKAGELGLSFATFIFMREWLLNHILKTDRGYGVFLRERGVE